MGDDDLGGRRDYDPEHPLISLMEQRLLRALDKGLTETRHSIRTELTVLATAVDAAKDKSTQEHSIVQLALVTVQGDIADLRKDVADLIPLKGKVAQIQSNEDRQAARDEGVEKMRKSILHGAYLLATLVVACTGVLVAVVA